ncbi:MAG TPA: hypothetical protein VD969_25105 [Symbiobacteriaceae bacterium]|nr:hypothetical protein [Symbiobacteriaceae bacterium]
MKPHAIGSSCQRVQAVLDEALATGLLSLPPELAAHAERCSRCGPEVKETEQLLSRLRGAAAGISLGPVPHAVDAVLAQISSQSAPRALILNEQPKVKRVRTRWILGQVAAVAAVLLITVGGLGFVILKLNEAVSGVKPGDVLAKLAAPFRYSDQAQVEKGK